MLATWALALGLGHLPLPLATPPVPPGRPDGDVHVSVWTDRDGPYQRGDGVRVFASTRVDSYLTVFRIDTDGGLRVLFPHEPWEDTWVRAGRVVEVNEAGGGFQVDDYPGVGYLFAVASSEPFDYSSIVRRDQWDYREIANGRIHGDPYVALTDLAERIAPDGGYDYDIAPYYVQKHYDYPRFVCYDCHTYAPYSGWDPYGAECARYRIVIYDDPYYYPYQAYGARAVGPTRPARLEPRFVFEDADGRAPWMTRTHRAPVQGETPGYREREPEQARWRTRNGGQEPVRRPVAAPPAAPAPAAAPSVPAKPPKKSEPERRSPETRHRESP
jgi:hypothetical protein